MRYKYLFLLLFFTFFLLTFFSSTKAVYLPSDKSSLTNKVGLMNEIKDNKPEYVPGEIIVKFKKLPIYKEGNNLEEIKKQYSSIAKIFDAYPAESINPIIKNKNKDNIEMQKIVKLVLKDKEKSTHLAKRVNNINIYDDDSSFSKIINKLKSDPNIEYAEPNYIYQLNMTPNDPLYPQQWHLPKIQAPEAWDISTGNNNVTVAVIDTGVDYNHEDLQGQIWQNIDEIPGNGFDDDNNGYIDDTRGWDFVNVDPYYCAIGEDCTNEDNSPSDFVGHGTHVAGIIGAKGNNNVGVVGICWNCKIMNLRAGWLYSNGDGGVDIAGASNAILYAVNNGANIINMSFGGGSYSDTFASVISYAHMHGLIMAASAGNNGMKIRNYPAAFDHVLSIAATNSTDNPASFTNYGSWIDLSAPGVNILSLRGSGTDMYGDGTHIVNDKYYIASGTSMSAPVTSGVVGLLKSKYPLWTNTEVERFIRSIIDPPNSNIEIGYGRINSFKALNMIYSSSQALLQNPYENNLDSMPIGTNNNIIAGARGSGYILEYGENLYPQQWNLINRQNTPIDSSGGTIMGVWDTSKLLQKIYTIRLTVLDTAGNPYYSSTRVQLYNPTFGWEKYLSSKYASEPTTADLNNDGQKEILVISAAEVFSNNLNLYVFNNDGSNYFANPIVLEGGRGFSSSPTVGDIDNDNYPEIVIVGENLYEFPSRNEGVIYIINHDGSMISGWNPKRIDDEIALNSRWCPAWGLSYSCGGFPSSAVIEDFNSDSKNEIILFSRYAKLYVLNIDGNNLPGFPKLLGEGLWFGNTFNTPAVADIDNDGQKEIAAALGDALQDQSSEGTFVYVVENDGSTAFGWPKKIVGDYIQYANYSSLESSPTIGDINNDRYMEIFVSSWNENGGKIYGWKYNGENITGWPVSAQRVRRNVTIGRFSNFKNPIIVAASYSGSINKVYAFDTTGNLLPGWPPVNSPFWIYAEPLFMDVNNDQKREVIFISENTEFAYAYNQEGIIIDNWPFYTQYPSFRTPIIEDINKDNNNEMIIVASNGTLVLRKLNSISSLKPDWNMFRHDERHTGAYENLESLFFKIGWNKIIWPEFSESLLPTNCPLYSSKSSFWNGQMMGFGSPLSFTSPVSTYILCH